MKPRAKLSTKKKILFSLIPLISLLLLAEIGVRIRRASIGSRNVYPARHDPELGFTNKENSSKIMWGGCAVDIDESGFRIHESYAPQKSTSEILAVGDSFVYGDGVANNQTWPAYLEQNLKLQVINAGVPAYGIDQTIIYAKRILKRKTPTLLIVSMIPHDLERAAVNYYYFEKPCYVMEDKLKLTNAPVPKQTKMVGTLAYKILSNSELFDMFAYKFANTWWTNQYKVNDRKRLNDPVKVANILLKELAEYARENNISMLLVLQGFDDKHYDQAKKVIAEASKNNIHTLDLYDEFSKLRKQSPELGKKYTLINHVAFGHMSPSGNEWVAQKIAAKIAASFPEVLEKAKDASQ